jgi:hypothetical protein
MAIQANFGATGAFADTAHAAATASNNAASTADTTSAADKEGPESTSGQKAAARNASSEEEVVTPKNFSRASTIVSTSQCKINCTAPHAACSGSAEVLSIVQNIYKALSERDFDAIGKYIDENCTKFDQATGTVIVGRKAIIEDLKNQMAKLGPGSKTPLLSYTIDHPYAHVSGDNAVVTFTAFKELGGEHPQKFESHCTDIFKREGNSWMKISYRSNWKEISL